MLILLDIDGVMVQASSWKPVELSNDGFYKFSPNAIIGLQRIISEAAADIVLTTSHKYSFSLSKWKSIFNDRGIAVSSVNRLEDNTRFLTRKEEILNWHQNNKTIQDFVIIDDDKSLNGLPRELRDKVVLTNPGVGLNDQDTLQAIAILKNSLLATA